MTQKGAKNNIPPAWPGRILEWFCSPMLVEEMQGDLLELYEKWTSKFGSRRAKLLYILHAIKFLRPYAFKRISTKYNSQIMIKNYVTFVFRRLTRSKAFSAINISGLVLGLACSLIIYLWVEDERRVDNFHSKGNQLYRVYIRQYFGDQVNASYNSPALLPETLKEDFPEVEYASGFAKVLRLSQQGDTYESFLLGDKVYKMRGSRAGEDFFSMFSYPLLAGSAATALNEPSGIAISRKMAELFFGSVEGAFGSTLKFSSENMSREVTVTAVFEDLPPSSSDQFDYLANWDYWVEHDDFKKYWPHFGTYSYIQLKAGTDPTLLEKKLIGYLDERLNIQKGSNVKVELGLQRFGDQYLYGNFENGRPVGGRIDYVNSMAIAAVVILIIACVNFMNLSAATSLKRAREVGVRKVAGASRINLMTQFLGETFILATFAIVVALIAAYIALPAFNALTEKQIILPLRDVSFIGNVVLTLTIVGIVAGSYPALLLSTFKPVTALKGKVKFSSPTAGFGKGMVVFQFALSILLIILTMVVGFQTAFIKNKDIGYNRDNVIYIRLEGALIKNYKAFKREAMRLPGIAFVDRSSQTPHTMGLTGPFVDWEGKDPDHRVNFIPTSVGYDYVKLLGLKIVEGRDFSDEFPADTTGFLVSESGIKEMGLKEPLGAMISVFNKKGPIIGIVNDFNGQSLHHSLTPIVIDFKESLNFGTILVRTKPGQTEEGINSLRSTYNTFNPGYAFSYSFLDDAFQRLYRSEQIISKLSTVFGSLSIFISCLGLLGLAVYAAEQRTKEMGIRKVLGATIGQIFLLFSRGFVKLIFVSILLAVPLAWLVADAWLQRFAYRIDLAWWIFALGGAFALFLALLTLGSTAIRAGIRNPVETLRTE
jgi:ABC-type antimicrobial peptide transport system permease subunit